MMKMKKTISTITLLSVALMALGCESDPAQPASTPDPAATAPSTQAIEDARAEGARTLPPELAGLASFADEPLSLPPVAPPSADVQGDLERQAQAISWGCRLAFYPMPQWWQGVFALQALKSLGVINDKATCKRVLSGGSALLGFLKEKGKEPYFAVLILIVTAGGSCACDYVF